LQSLRPVRRVAELESFGGGGAAMTFWSLLAGVALLAILGGLAVVVSTLQRMERKLNALMRQANLDPLLGVALSERVKELARDPSHRDEAIKVYREETGKGQEEAEKAIDAYVARL
jgi:hypothetical protein